jgi:hypothetical protein
LALSLFPLVPLPRALPEDVGHNTRLDSGNKNAVGPFAQARDAAQQEEEEEHADHKLRKVTIERRNKGLCSSTKMYFLCRNDSYLAQKNVYLSQSSKEMHMTSDVFGLSVGIQSCAKIMKWQACHLIT